MRSRFSEPSTLRLIVLGAAVEAAGLTARSEVEAELGRDHDLVADGLERLADELFVGERAVDLRGVEEGDAALDGGADQRDHLLLVRRAGRRPELMPMQPSPIAETWRSLPSIRFCMSLLSYWAELCISAPSLL